MKTKRSEPQGHTRSELVNGSTGLSSSEAGRLSRSPSPPLHYEKLRKALVQPLQRFLAVPPLIHGFTGKSIRSGVHTHPPRMVASGNSYPWHLRIHSNHPGTAHGLDFKSTSPLRDTENLLAAPTPATQMEGVELGAGRWPPLNLCQGLKLVSEEREIVHFLSLRCPGKYFTGEKENWESGESILPTHPRTPGLSDHHFNREPLWDPGHTGPVNASSHTRSWNPQ